MLRFRLSEMHSNSLHADGTNMKMLPPSLPEALSLPGACSTPGRVCLPANCRSIASFELWVGVAEMIGIGSARITPDPKHRQLRNAGLSNPFPYAVVFLHPRITLTRNGEMFYTCVLKNFGCLSRSAYPCIATASSFSHSHSSSPVVQPGSS